MLVSYLPRFRFDICLSAAWGPEPEQSKRLFQAESGLFSTILLSR